MHQNRAIKLFYDSYSGLSKDIWFLAIVTLINRAGALVLPFLSLYLATIKGYSLSLTGVIMLFFGVGSFFGNYIGGILTDKIGAFRIQFLSLLTTGFSFFVLAELDSPWTIAAGLFVTSLLADSFRPANMASVGVLTTEEKRTKAVGVMRLAINLGFSVGPAIGGLIAFSMGYLWLFWIDGATCLIAALVMFYFFRKQIQEEKAKVKETKNEEKPSIKLVLKDTPFVLFLPLVITIGFVFMQYFNSIPVFFKEELFLNEDQIGILMGLNGVLIVLLELPIIELYQQRNKSALIAIGSILLAICYLLLLYTPWAGVAVISVILFTIGEIFTLPFITSAIINRAPENLRGRYLALYGMAFSITHMLTPLISLRLADQLGFASLWIIVSILAVLTAWGYWRLRREFA